MDEDINNPKTEEDSALTWYEALLAMNDRSLTMVIDLYNKDLLAPKARLALEAIEAEVDCCG